MMMILSRRLSVDMRMKGVMGEDNSGKEGK
jgi:hypothetical protein